METSVLALSGDLEGRNKTDANNGKSESGWTGSILRGWQELDMVPCRIVLQGPADNQPVTISFPRTRKGVPAFDDLFFMSNSPNVTVTGPVLNSPADAEEWSYSFQVTIDGNAPGYVYFNARLGAGVHLNPGGSLHLRGEPALSPLVIHKPGAALSKPDLGVRLTGLAQALPGETVAYSAHFTNSATGSNDIARNVVLKAVLPEGLSLVPGSASAGAEIAGNTLIWRWTELGPQASGVVTWQAVVDGVAPISGVLTTTGAIQGTENDLSPEDNLASVHTMVGSANPGPLGGPLRITRIIKFDAEIYHVYFQTMPGRNYSMQYTEDFVDWATDSTVIPGTGTEVVSRQREGGAQRYYRVLELP